MNEEIEGKLGTTSQDIEGVDQNLTIDEIFQQNKIDSLAKYVCSVSPLYGPSGAIFNLKSTNTGVKLLRQEVVTFPSDSVKTDITSEAIHDLVSMFGIQAYDVIGKLLRGISNEKENTRLFEVLDASSKVEADLTLTDSKNALSNYSEITQKVQELIIKMNSKDFRTFESFVILPYYAVASMSGISTFNNDTDSNADNLFLTRINKTSYFLNPDINSTKAYVGLKDTNMSKSSLYFVPYTSEIQESVDPDSGLSVYRIYNRFAIETSVLHETDNEMLYTFNIIK